MSDKKANELLKQPVDVAAELNQLNAGDRSSALDLAQKHLQNQNLRNVLGYSAAGLGGLGGLYLLHKQMQRRHSLPEQEKQSEIDWQASGGSGGSDGTGILSLLGGLANKPFEALGYGKREPGVMSNLAGNPAMWMIPALGAGGILTTMALKNKVDEDYEPAPESHKELVETERQFHDLLNRERTGGLKQAHDFLDNIEDEYEKQAAGIVDALRAAFPALALSSALGGGYLTYNALERHAGNDVRRGMAEEAIRRQRMTKRPDLRISTGQADLEDTDTRNIIDLNPKSDPKPDEDDTMPQVSKAAAFLEELGLNKAAAQMRKGVPDSSHPFPKASEGGPSIDPEAQMAILQALARDPHTQQRMAKMLHNEAGWGKRWLVPDADEIHGALMDPDSRIYGSVMDQLQSSGGGNGDIGAGIDELTGKLFPHLANQPGRAREALWRGLDEESQAAIGQVMDDTRSKYLNDQGIMGSLGGLMGAGIDTAEERHRYFTDPEFYTQQNELMQGGPMGYLKEFLGNSYGNKLGGLSGILGGGLGLYGLAKGNPLMALLGAGLGLSPALYNMMKPTGNAPAMTAADAPLPVKGLRMHEPDLSTAEGRRQATRQAEALKKNPIAAQRANANRFNQAEPLVPANSNAYSGLNNQPAPQATPQPAPAKPTTTASTMGLGSANAAQDLGFSNGPAAVASAQPNPSIPAADMSSPLGKTRKVMGFNSLQGLDNLNKSANCLLNSMFNMDESKNKKDKKPTHHKMHGETKVHYTTGGEADKEADPTKEDHWR